MDNRTDVKPTGARCAGAWRWAMFAVYAVAVLVGVIRHEPYRDEAQAWMIARDATPAELWELSGQEGTPMLWHLAMMPLAKSGVTMKVGQIASALPILLAAWLLIFKSPLRWWQLLIFLTSYCMIFEYALILRSYTASIGILFILAAMHDARLRRPIVYGLLLLMMSQTSVFGAIMAGAIGAVFCVDVVLTRQWKPGTLVALVLLTTGIALAYVQIQTPDDIKIAIWSTDDVTPDDAGSVTGSMAATIKRWFMPFEKMLFFPLHPSRTLHVLTALFLAAMLATAARSWRAMLVLVISYGGILYILAEVFDGAHRHRGFLLMMFVYALWVGSKAPERRSDEAPERSCQKPLLRPLLLKRIETIAAFVAFLLLGYTIYTGVQRYALDVAAPYSAGQAMATFIEEEGIKGPIAGYQDQKCTAVMVHLPDVPFWQMEQRRYGSYVSWLIMHQQDGFITAENAAKDFVERFQGQDAWLLLSRPLKDPAAFGLSRLHRAEPHPKLLATEMFELYTWAGDADTDD